MIINNNYRSYNSYNSINRKNNDSYSNNSNQNQNVNFSGKKTDFIGKCFNWLADQCDIDNHYSFKRLTFVVIGTIMLAGRFFEGRGKDEKREVLTRDIPAVVIAGYGAIKLNEAIADIATKKTGVPIIQISKVKQEGIFAKLMGNEGKEKTVKSFASQKQIIEWYSNLKSLKNPAVTFAETIHKNQGNLNKVMSIIGLSDEVKNITKKENATNEEIISALKKAKEAKDASFNKIVDKVKNLGSDNELLKKAKNIQAGVKLAGIGLTVGILGYFLPRLNIVMTKKKYQNLQQNNQIKQK